MTGCRLFGGFKVVDSWSYLQAVEEIGEMNAAVLARSTPTGKPSPRRKAAATQSPSLLDSALSGTESDAAS